MRKEAEEFLRETGREDLIDKVQVLVRGENRYKGDPLAGVAYPKRVMVGWKVRSEETNRICPVNNAPCNECVPGAYCAKTAKEDT